MWNPIVSGSTDLWQHVWMYYSMPVEVREAGERTQDYRHKQQQSECMSFRKCKEQKYTDKNNICFFLPVSVVAHYATDWNLESIHRAEPSRAEPSRAVASSYSCQKKKNQRWCLTLPGHAEVLLNRSCYGSHRRSQQFIFIAVMFNQLPWELGHPPLLLLLHLHLHLHPSLGASVSSYPPPPDTKRSSLRRKPCC